MATGRGRGNAVHRALTTFAMVVTLVALASTQSSGPAAAQLRILFPSAAASISGAVTLRAEISPPVSDAEVVFFGDGRQLCATRTVPFECRWDAGLQVAEHVIRVTATLPGGGRLTDTVRTRDPRRSASVAVFSATTDAVQLAVTVEDEDARNHGKLPASAFHVFEDGAAQEISSFVATDAPLDVVVAADTSASMTAAMPALKSAVAMFLAAVPPQDAVSLLAFNSDLIEVGGYDAAPDERQANVDRLVARGTTRLYDAILRSVTMLRSSQRRKAVVVFTDGEDEGSRASLDDVERRLQASDVALYMIGAGRGTTMRNLQKVMTRLVEPTGGRAFFTSSVDDLKATFRELLDELSRQYLVTYTPADLMRDGRWRRIRVVVDGHRRVRTRAGYRLSTN
jgi:Ca-activated chloride channel homolog